MLNFIIRRKNIYERPEFPSDRVTKRRERSRSPSIARSVYSRSSSVARSKPPKRRKFDASPRRYDRIPSRSRSRSRTHSLTPPAKLIPARRPRSRSPASSISRRTPYDRGRPLHRQGSFSSSRSPSRSRSRSRSHSRSRSPSRSPSRSRSRSRSPPSHRRALHRLPVSHSLQTKDIPMDVPITIPPRLSPPRISTPRVPPVARNGGDHTNGHASHSLPVCCKFIAYFQSIYFISNSAEDRI